MKIKQIPSKVKTSFLKPEEIFTSDDLALYIKDLEHIVNIDSPTKHVQGIDNVAAFFEQAAKEHSLNVERILVNKDAGACVVISNIDNIESSSHIDVLLMAHIDTVFEVGSTKDHPFVLKNDGIAYGCGVVDNKAGALMGLYIMQKLDLSNKKVALLLNTNEETGSELNSNLIENLSKKASYVFNLEPLREDGSFVEKRYGVANYKIYVKGKNPEGVDFSKGTSALVEASAIIKHLQSLNNHFKGLLLNFTINTSETKHLGDVVDDVTIGLQARYLSQEFIDNLNLKLDKLATNKFLAGSEIRYEMLNQYPAMHQTKVIRDLKKDIWLIAKRLKHNVSWSSSFGGSDACFASNVNANVIDGMGPMGGNFHTKQEYLDTNTVAVVCNILLNTIDLVTHKPENIMNENQSM